MDFNVKTISSDVLNTNFIYYALILAGVWAVMCWSIDNLKSVIQIIKSFLTPYFRPQENKSLVERYGKWAGKIIFNESKSGRTSEIKWSNVFESRSSRVLEN